MIPEITERQTVTDDANLSHFADRANVIIGLEYMYCSAGNSRAYRHPAWHCTVCHADLPNSGDYAAFGWPIAIKQWYFRMTGDEGLDMLRRSFFASKINVLKPREAVLVLVYKKVEKGRCKKEGIDSSVFNSFLQHAGKKVVAVDQHDRSPCGKLPPQLERVHIPWQSRRLRSRVARAKSRQSAGSEKPGDGPVRADYPFRFAGRAGSEEDRCRRIGANIDRIAERRVLIGRPNLTGRQFIDAESMWQIIVGDRQDWSDVVQDTGLALERPARIHSRVGRPALQHGKLHGHKPRRTRDHQWNDHAGSDTPLGEFRGVLARDGLKLAVGYTPLAMDQCDGIGRPGGMKAHRFMNHRIKVSITHWLPLIAEFFTRLAGRRSVQCSSTYSRQRCRVSLGCTTVQPAGIAMSSGQSEC